MNISQHCFVPRTKTLPGYYSLSGSFNAGGAGGSVLTTEKQIGDIYNCFQLFGSYVPTTSSWYALRLFDSPTGQHSDNYVGYSSDGYVSPTLVKKSDVYTSSAYTSSTSSYPGVVCVMWREHNVSLRPLSLGNTFSPDVIDGEII